MKEKKDREYHFIGPVLNRRIRGWKGTVAFVNIGLSAAVIALAIFNVMFLLSGVELPTEIEPMRVEAREKAADIVAVRPKRDLADYAAITSRNMFSPDRKEWEHISLEAGPSQVEDLDEALAKKSGLSLMGVIIAGDIKKALLKGTKGTTFLKEGDELDGYKVVGIEPKRVVMSLNGREFAVTLYKKIPSLSFESVSADVGEAEADEEEMKVANWAEHMKDIRKRQESLGRSR